MRWRTISSRKNGLPSAVSIIVCSELIREVGDGEERADQGVGLLASQRIEGNGGVISSASSPTGPSLGQLRSAGQISKMGPVDLLGQLLEDVQQCRIRPVDVLDDGNHW